MGRLSYEEILQDLEQFLQFCSTIGLQESKGRFTQYRHAIVALMDAIRTRSLAGQDETLLLDSGVLCSNVVRESELIFKAIEK
jgi:hypothetical protein